MAAVIIAQKYKTVYPVCEQKDYFYFDWNALNEDAVNFEQSPSAVKQEDFKGCQETENKYCINA